VIYSLIRQRSREKSRALHLDYTLVELDSIQNQMFPLRMRKTYSVSKWAPSVAQASIKEKSNEPHKNTWIHRRQLFT
jgi:hypothetical protein